VIAITAHLGSTEVVGQMPTVLVCRSRAWPADRAGPPVPVHPRLRRSHGLNLVPSDQSPIVLFRALQRGEIVALPCDQDYSGQGHTVSFFGAQTRLPDGALRIAFRTGAPVLPVFALRLPDDTFVLEFEPPLQLPDSGDRAADLDVAVEHVVSLMERRIRAHPEQWLVTGRVWPGE